MRRFVGLIHSVPLCAALLAGCGAESPQPPPGTTQAGVRARAQAVATPDKAVKNGKLYSLGIKAGQDGAPDWIFSHGVSALKLQDSGNDDETIVDEGQARHALRFAVQLNGLNRLATTC